MMRWFQQFLTCVVASAWLLPASGGSRHQDRSAQLQVVRIGVLAHRGEDEALQRWSATASYLSQHIAGKDFKIIPVNLDEIDQAIGDGQLDFTLTNPGNYVYLETRYGASRIATLQTREKNRIRVRYGAVIISRMDNAAVKTIADLRGKSFMAVSLAAFGGFQMAWRELADNGIDPFEDFSALRFAGFPQDRIVLAVLSGEVDAATVRSETLVRMNEAGKVDMGRLRILNARHSGDDPLPLSTRLYPEWPLATLRQTPRDLAAQVARALLAMPVDDVAAQASHTAGWTIPLDYSPVHELMKELQIGPYEVLRQASITGIVKRYAWWLAAAAALLLFLLFLNGYISRTNRKLKKTQHKLRNEIRERERSQAALARYRDTLEEQVAGRTEDLRLTNLALEKSRVALRELVMITSAPDLSHEQRLGRLLDTGRNYYGLPIAVLASIDNGEQRVCRISGDAGLLPDPAAPLDERCARELVTRHGEPLDIPDLETDRPEGCICLRHGWKSYLGVAVMVESRVHCTLEFAGTRPRAGLLSKWDYELLKVMAQWIGDELERQQALESQQRHQAEIIRVSRLSALGEMAASLAHELNQPLTGVINYSNGCLRMLRDGESRTDKLSEGMEQVVEGATLAADIIREIRSFTRRGDEGHGCVDLNTAVRNVVTLAAPEARRHEVNIDVDLDERLPAVTGNMIQLEQVILNFIRNGIDAVSLTNKKRRQLLISTRHDDKQVRLVATDSGEGIAAAALPKIFDAFYTTKADGMGIGLSISRSIIESHQGRIAARSLPQGGAAFSFELPVAG